MDRSNITKFSLLSCSRRAKRTAALLCAALAGLGLVRGAAAQNSPQQHSPQIPTPYQWPLFHGGGSDPTLSLTPPFLNPLYGQLQGTPTETVPGTGAGPGYPVQIPSLLLGNYKPSKPPAGGGNYYPNHLADGSIVSWAAPFNYFSVTDLTTLVDDSSVTASPNFVLTGTWQTQTLGAAAGTADGGGYYRLPPGNNGTATWTLTVPTPAPTVAIPVPLPVPGGYSVYFHLPANILDDSGAVEPRSTQVTYTVTVNGSNAQTNTATVSQTESNSLQFLAGPFQLAAGDTVVVTLQRDATHNQNTYQPGATPPVLDYLVADSMTLKPAIGDVQCAPTAINYDSYPNEFKQVKYWGFYVNPGRAANGAVLGVTGTDENPPDTTGLNTPTPNPVPLANRIFNYGDVSKLSPDTAADPHYAEKHHIRQLVYFGRQEPTFSNGVTVDDSAGAAAFSPGNFVPSTYTNVGATNNNYHSDTGTNGGGLPALWTMAAPTGGDYYVTVHLPATPLNAAGAVLENRTSAAVYTITYGNPLVTRTVQISQITGTAKDVTLPTGPIALTSGETLTVTVNAAPGNGQTNRTVVADSVRITTGGAGAIYCVDGFSGAVVWRYQTQGSQNGASAPVFSSPAVTKINVMVQPASGGSPALYANKLVVIVGDNNGLVYCLDAMGNGDGTSNSAVINANTNLPNYIAQPSYGPFTNGTYGLPTTAPLPVDDPNYPNNPPHVGTTGVYWIYRPDVNNPKYATGTNIGKVKRNDPAIPSGNTFSDPLSDMPVPASFNTASPNVFVNPNVSTVVDATGYIPALTVGAKTLPPSNAIVYIGNSNGVLYALDATGVGLDTTSAALYYNSGTPNPTNLTVTNPGDRFSASQDLRHIPGVFQQTAAGAPDPNYDPTDSIVPTPQTLWWFSLRGPDPNSSDNASNADIESAPALYVAPKASAQPTGYDFTPTVYIGSAHELENTSNIGRLYALNGLVGPSGNNGTSDPTLQPDPTLPQYTGPGSQNYNLAPRPQINKTDKFDWAFPDAYDTTQSGIGQSSNKKPRPALGNVTGSPVVFTDTNETGLLADGVTKARTRIYFAANAGLEVAYNGTDGTTPSARPDDTETGRVWAVNLDGSVGTTTNTSGANAVPWSYPLANDPNNAAKDKIHEPQAPMGSFLHGTPAIGFIQFPAVITNGDLSTYAPKDVINTGVNGIKGQKVPMLYIATRGVNDEALYAIDIDGNVNPSINAANPATNDDQRLIYRETSFDGSIFQSSPVLVSNTSTPTAGGNGGSVYITAGNSLYDYGATPISNPDPTVTQPFPLIRLNRAYTGFGPISAPAIAASDTTDRLTPTDKNNYTTATVNDTPGGFNNIVTDWIYVGDSSTGFCRGITPYDTSDLGIPGDIGATVPPAFDPPGEVDLATSLQVYLVPNTPAASRSQDSTAGYPVGSDKALPVYDWGENVYIRIKNVVPPGFKSPGVPNAVIDESLPLDGSVRTVYGNGGPIEFDISDSSPGAPADHGTVPAVLYAAPSTPLRDGFITRTDADPSVTTSPPVYLVDPSTRKGYIGAYTYAISDGSARRNTPGATRHILNVRQIVEVYTTTNGITFTDKNQKVTLTAQVSSGNEVTTGTPGSYSLAYVPPVDQPTFGILNPLAVRGGGIPLLSGSTFAQPIGDTLGPFQGAGPPPTPAGVGGDPRTLEALTNGNRVLVHPPASTSGGGLTSDPTKRSYAETSPDTQDKVVVTATGLIPHNDSSDNFDNSDNSGLVPLPQGVNPTGLSGTSFGSQFAPYACDLADRSALGLGAKQLRVKAGTVSGGGDGLYWNDNTSNISGHDSVVNFLPWETAPVGYNIGSNPSVDYPDISPSHIATYLHFFGDANGQDMTLGNAYTKPASGLATDALNRTVYLNPIQFHINIPRFQSANQQLYQEIPGQGKYASTGQIAPPPFGAGALSAGNNIFPMGYVTSRRIYVPDQSGFYREGAAYREVRVYTGVPPDFGLQMGTNTVDIGQPVPSAFGVQTALYTGYTNAANTDFNPYNTAFHDYYQALPIFNTGNVNLINVHLDQQIARSPGGPISPLVMSSDSVDPLSYIPAWDYQGVTGRNSLTLKNNFLVRSSLDSDIAVVNPVMAANYPGQYPGPTFHKARVGDANPTQMTMPDVPHDNFGLYSLATESPVAGDDKPESNTATPSPNFATPPYVSVAIPFGTPVGTYHLPKTIQAFEGYDNPLTYSPLYPPTYGGILPGRGAAINNTPITYLVSQNPPPVGPFVKGAPSQHPVSGNGTDIKITVVEDRMNDGFTYGGLPMVDAGPAAPAVGGNPTHPTPDFAPAGFRDLATGNLSMYWTTGRTAPGFGIQAANVTMNQNPTLPGGVKYFQPISGGQTWWNNFAPFVGSAGTNSGLTVAQDFNAPTDFANDPTASFAFVVNVQGPPTVGAYQNTLLCYPVKQATGDLDPTAQVITNDPSQVKYGVKGLYFTKIISGFTNNLWAFWTTTVRGRTAINYNSTVAPGTATWPLTTGALPVPAGLTAVADPAPLLVAVPPTSGTKPVPAISVTYSGTGPDGNIDLYESRYQQDATTASKLDLIPFPAITEILQATGQPGGWLQSRDVAWSRTGILNLFMSNGTATPSALLYDAANKPLFSRAVFDKASGYLVLPGISPTATVGGSPYTLFSNVPAGGTVTAYIDLATGRVRFTAMATGKVYAEFNPLARRITTDSRADTGPITFLDSSLKVNETGPYKNGAQANVVETNRRWYIWRKSGTGGGAPSATIYYKTQRLTAFLPRPIKIDPTTGQAVSLLVKVNGVTVYDSAAVAAGSAPGLADIDAARGRVYFQTNGQFSEGQTFDISYTDIDGNTHSNISDIIQWQDEEHGNSNPAPTDTANGLNSVFDTQLPISKALNEDNVSAFLDPFVYSSANYPNVIGAGGGAEHKVWLFWNSTRNGTADVYYETINPLFSAIP